MVDTVLYTIISLSTIGVVAAVILYIVARRFRVFEDPRIDQVEEILPAANCGGCGFPGCRNFAEALVSAESFEGLHCPVGGNEVMVKVASFLGKDAVMGDPLVAVVRCAGSFDQRPRTNRYDGAPTCSISSALYTGETGCPYGCLGLGDCVWACDYEAMYMDEQTGLPVILDDRCVACGACVNACPRNIIELRKKAKKDRKIFVACINEEKGGIARKYCNVACIGCSRCFKVCPFDAITMDNNLAFIDSEKCKLCRKCAPECPTNAILEINFPQAKPKEAAREVKQDDEEVHNGKSVPKEGNGNN
ncbi:MAG: Fe-S cluster domain-containing protein [Bacteroidales bacterium]|nr:MAG: Fe-S cluster domain-containing protein [Bacteroidales bacterium]